MKPLIVLLSTFFIIFILSKIIKKDYRWQASARIAFSIMLFFTAIGHFKFPEGMATMLPNWFPYRIETIYLTGFLEIAGGIGLLIPTLQKTTAWLLIIFFIIILPSNIYASLHHINYETGAQDGEGLLYLWFRIPLQVFFIMWVYFSSIKNKL